MFRLISPRPTFPMDMTESERKGHGEHVTYWTALRDKGIAIVFGPVLDPKGVWESQLLRHRTKRLHGPSWQMTR